MPPSNQRVLVLASGSPRRQELLRALGVPFDVRPTDVDETPLVDEAPAELVRRLSAAKADAALGAAPEPDVVVLGADTVVVVDGEVLGKPVDAADASRMLRRLSGRSHVVLTGVAVAHRSAPAPESRRSRERDGALGPAAGLAAEVEATEVTFRPLSDVDIATYVQTSEPFDKAGAYAIQGAGGHFVSAVRGNRDNVVGLGLDTTRRLLSACGIEIP